jgi:hypothetical protein
MLGGMEPRGWRGSEVAATVVPAALLVVPPLVLVAFKPFKATEAVGSLQAVAILTGVGVAWVAAMVVLHRFTGPAVRGTVMGVVSVALAAVMVVPSIRDVQVVEDRPELAQARVDTAPGTTAPGTTVPGATAPGATAAGGDVSSTTTTAPPAEVGPTHEATGSLRGVGHRASGEANLFRGADGAFVVELLDIDIEPGPDYILYLAPGLGQDSPVDGSIELDALRGNLGTQYYDVPGGTELDGDWSVVVWCRAFAVPVAAADLTPT